MTTLVENPNLIFIHIPKNGGTSITKWLRKYLSGIKGSIAHSGVKHICKEFNHAINYPTFAVVRNPWDRIVSTYEFKKGRGQIKTTFEEWLLKDPEENKNWFSFKTPQSKWLDNEPTWILKFENLELDFIKIQKYTNCFEPLEHVNASIKKNYKEYYNIKTKDYVKTLFHEDIEKFNYTF